MHYKYDILELTGKYETGIGTLLPFDLIFTSWFHDEEGSCFTFSLWFVRAEDEGLKQLNMPEKKPCWTD